MDWTNLLGVLAWIAAGSGSIFLVNYGLSLLVENWPAWHNFPRAVKFLAPLVMAILMAVGAQLALDYGQVVIEYIQPWWIIIVNIAIAWLGSQKAYIGTKDTGYAESAKNGG